MSWANRQSSRATEAGLAHLGRKGANARTGLRMLSTKITRQFPGKNTRIPDDGELGQPPQQEPAPRSALMGRRERCCGALELQRVCDQTPNHMTGSLGSSAECVRSCPVEVRALSCLPRNSFSPRMSVAFITVFARGGVSVDFDRATAFRAKARQQSYPPLDSVTWRVATRQTFFECASA